MVEWIWPNTPIAITITLVTSEVLRWVVLHGIRKATDTAVSRADRHRTKKAVAVLDVTGQGGQRYAARAATMGSLLRSLTNVVIVILTVLTIMAILGIPMAPLLASAGIGGIALGFGAQSLVKDYLAGIFMIVEDQYGVGDLVNLGDVSGTVEEVGLRVTRVRDASGQIWYIRNGEVLRVGNQTQGWSTATIDIPVDPSADSMQVIRLLQQVVEGIAAEEQWEAVLIEAPDVVGVNAVTAGSMTFRIIAKTLPNQHWGLQREILDRGVRALKDASVRGPRVLPAAPPVA
jgi:small-conductance mechanosensitive channel